MPKRMGNFLVEEWHDMRVFVPDALFNAELAALILKTIRRPKAQWHPREETGYEKWEFWLWEHWGGAVQLHEQRAFRGQECLSEFSSGDLDRLAKLLTDRLKSKGIPVHHNDDGFNYYSQDAVSVHTSSGGSMTPIKP